MSDLPSKADICSAQRHVRFGPKADISSGYSITSSAVASSVGGIARPISLAVFRLITSLYLVGACTGRSAGFSPLRMRSTELAERRNLLGESSPKGLMHPLVTKLRSKKIAGTLCAR